MEGGGTDVDSPVPNPPPAPGDHVPSSLVSARSALRRSLLVWGLGQVAAGDRRGWLGPLAQAGALGLLVAVAPLARGTQAPLVFLVASLVLAVWAGVGAPAWRRAAKRRAALGASPGGGAADLLWLTPLALALGSVFWAVPARGTDPALVLDAWLTDVRTGRLTSAVDRLAGPPVSVGALEEAWDRQRTSLRNELVRILAEAPSVEADPDEPLTALRWVDLGEGPDGRRAFAAEIAGEEIVRDRLFGLLPTTSRRLVAVRRVGQAELRPVAVPGTASLLGPVTEWRIAGVEFVGDVIGRVTSE